MATIQYPALLGGFLRENYSYQLNPGIRRTPLANGHARQRRAANQRTKINVLQKLTVEQMQVFEIFILRSGWDWFLAEIETGEGMRQTECRIIEGSVTSALTSAVVSGQNVYQVGFVMELQKTNAIADDLDLTDEHIEAFYTYGLNDVQQAETIDPLSPLLAGAVT